MDEQDGKLILMGKIGRPHGQRGEVRLFLYNHDSDTLDEDMPVVIISEKGDQSGHVIESIRYLDKFALIKFKGVSHRDCVDALKHGEIAVDSALLPELEDDQFYHAELIDLPVYIAADEGRENPELFGRISRFFETGANDVFVVERPDGSEFFVPMIENAICDIDTDEARVLIWPLERWAAAEDAGK